MSQAAGHFGLGVRPPLSPEQTTFFRAGHAHDGVLLFLSLVIQVLLDHATLSAELGWALRIGAPLLYMGAALVSVVTGIGLVR